MSSPSDDAMQKMFQEWMRCAAPGAPHKLLEKMAGKWTTHTRQWMDPSAPPSESAGSSEGKMMFGGRFLVANVIGQCMGQKTETMTIMGYDVFKERYLSIAFGSMGTAVYSAAGAVSADGKTLTFLGEMDDPMGKRPVRYVIRIEGDDKHVLEVFDSCMGKEVRVVETTHARVK